jgi:hypothetical protein
LGRFSGEIDTLGIFLDMNGLNKILDWDLDV